MDSNGLICRLKQSILNALDPPSTLSKDSGSLAFLWIVVSTYTI